MTYKFNNVYIDNTYTIGGVYEANGPLKKYFDKIYDEDFYFGEKSIEQAEIKLSRDAVNGLLKKCSLNDGEVDLLIAGDLQNQISASNYMARSFKIPFLGIYNACATSSEGISIASVFIESKKIKNCIVTTSSHNLVAEKQFRNPIEYGAPKPETATFTATGGTAMLLSNKKSKIRVSSATIGMVQDLGIKDVNHMGAVMAPAAADTIYKHLTATNTSINDYDLILTGDLGEYGKNILTDYMKEQYNIELGNNYNDCGCILYDTKKQPVLAGGSGPVCSSLVYFSYVLEEMKNNKLKKVLVVPTGAIFSPTLVFQKETIPSIAHAICLEVVE